MSGIPNWTHDIGGFAVEQRHTDQRPEAQAEWREPNLRWFQFGAFSPLFRSHGDFPHRQIYAVAAGGDAMRTAAHTSALQSLMRIPHARFCLKKKTNNERK